MAGLARPDPSQPWDDPYRLWIESPKVYFVGALDSDGHVTAVKIGHTVGNPYDRIAELQVGCPQTLKLLGCVLGGRDAESYYHTRLRHLRIRGEWFRPERDLWQVISLHTQLPVQCTGDGCAECEQ
jgi:hypothetical protein